MLPEYEKNIYSIYVDNQESSFLFAEKNGNEIIEASEEIVKISNNLEKQSCNH